MSSMRDDNCHGAGRMRMNARPGRGCAAPNISSILKRSGAIRTALLLQNHHRVAKLASRQRLDRPIQRHQPSLFLDRHAQKIGIAHLLMSEDPFGKRKHRIEDSDLHWPKAVAGKLVEAVEHGQSLVDMESWMGEPGVGYDPHKARFGKWASRPMLGSGLLEPALHRAVGYVPLENQRDQNVDVQEKGVHGSSASRAFTCWLVIGWRVLGRSKTGRPSTSLMRGAFRVPRTINSAMALLSDRSRLCAYCAAIAATSSSSVTVVLMTEIMPQGID